MRDFEQEGEEALRKLRARIQQQHKSDPPMTRVQALALWVVFGVFLWAILYVYGPHAVK